MKRTNLKILNKGPLIKHEEIEIIVSDKDFVKHEDIELKLGGIENA